MKKIYNEYQQAEYQSPHKEVDVFYPSREDGELDLPPIICIENGHYDNDRIARVTDNRLWVVYGLPDGERMTEARAIREGQRLFDAVKLEGE